MEDRVPLTLKRTEEMSLLQEQHNSQSTAVSLIYIEKCQTVAAKAFWRRPEDQGACLMLGLMFVFVTAEGEGTFRKLEKEQEKERPNVKL